MTDTDIRPEPLAPARGRVHIVDDDRGVRESLQLLLQLHGLEPRTYADAEEFMEATGIDRPACALLDVRLPRRSGLDLQQWLMKNRPGLPVIVMTGHGDVAMARAVLRAGAVDFLEKPLDEADLLDAVSSALRGDAERVQSDLEKRSVYERMQRLTERERAVFERITNGMHNREIASAFGISPRTVEVHRARLMEKLQARRVADLFRIRFQLERDDGDRA